MTSVAASSLAWLLVHRMRVLNDDTSKQNLE